ncbi:MAG: deaminase [Thermodesulfovibrionales bacterium]|nr:deaminase [Thermodesulfovibrionales bacterium]
MPKSKRQHFSEVLRKKKSKRPGWDEYFINIAKAVSTRATCLRRKYGAVITKDNIIVSTGYNGAPAGMKDCLEVGKCTRKELQIPHGERYELCHSVHAEANAVIRAAVHELEGATIYISGEDNSAGECHSEPCMMCKRIILNARIARVGYSDGNGNFHIINPKEWLKKRV